MEKNTIFKTIGFVGFVFGAGAMSVAIYNRYKRKEDEITTADALVKADILTQSFSGANGKTSKSAAHLCTDGKRTWFSNKPCGVIGSDDAVGRNTGIPCNSGDINEGTYHTSGGGKMICVPSATSRKINLKNNPIPTGAGFASVDSRLK